MEKNLTTGSVFKNVILFSLPYLFSYFLQTLYGMADLFIIGQFEGVASTTAVSIGSQVMHMLTVIIVGLAMGTTVSIGQAIGAGDRRQAAKDVGNTVTLFMAVSVTLMAVLLVLVRPIVAAMSTPTEAVDGTAAYLTICFIGIPFITAYNIISSIFRGMGDSKSPMYFIAVACAANIGLDYLFMGVFHLGPAGAALGTTLSQAISVSSLRHYENIGLLTPAYISLDSGYRYYGTEQFEVLNTIRYLRALDMPLTEIEDFLKNKDIGLIEEKLRQQKQAVLKKQQELKRIEQKIDHRLNWLTDAESAPLDVVSLIPLPACRIVWVDDPLKINGSADMEAPIRKLDQSDAEAVVFLGKVGLGISVEHLQKAETAQYDGIFLILDREDIYTGETLELPETLCVRLRFRGSHAEAPEQYQKLLDYIDKHKMQIVGFSREVTLIDYGITNDTEKFVTEICIPVKCE